MQRRRLLVRHETKLGFAFIVLVMKKIDMTGRKRKLRIKLEYATIKWIKSK